MRAKPTRASDVPSLAGELIHVHHQDLERSRRRFSALPRPFLRWAGSKQALLPQIVPLLPASFGTYFEPFLGSAALFFHLKPERARLSDVCQELVSTYLGVRDHCVEIAESLAPLKPEKSLFYKMRSEEPQGLASQASRFLYLNKCCWNGLYRVNSSGKFNVPYGAPRSDNIFDPENLKECSNILSRDGIEISRMDFEKSIVRAKAGDFVFLDPPYVTKHNNNGFRDYNESLFSWDDQIRLSECARGLGKIGVKVVVTNADHEDLHQLYKGFRVHKIERSSTLASDPTRRARVTESVFTNFDR